MANFLRSAANLYSNILAVDRELFCEQPFCITNADTFRVRHLDTD